MFSRLFILLALVATITFNPISAQQAEAQQVVEIAGSKTVYVLPRIEERLQNPLDVYTVVDWISVGDSIRQTFERKILPLRHTFDLERLTVLTVDRVVFENNPSKAVFWFTFIETDKLVPVEDLPPLQKD